MANLRVQGTAAPRSAIVAILAASSLTCAPAKAAAKGDHLAIGAHLQAKMSKKPQDARIPKFKSTIAQAIEDLSGMSKEFEPVSIQLAPAPSGELWYFTATIKETSSAYDPPRSIVSTAKGAIGIYDDKVYFTEFPKIA